MWDFYYIAFNFRLWRNIWCKSSDIKICCWSWILPTCACRVIKPRAFWIWDSVKPLPWIPPSMAGMHFYRHILLWSFIRADFSIFIYLSSVRTSCKCACVALWRSSFYPKIISKFLRIFTHAASRNARINLAIWKRKVRLSTVLLTCSPFWQYTVCM